jgi:transmembrane sensor
MSEALRTNAQSIKDEAANWLERRDREDWSDEDRAALEAWLSQSLAHRTQFWRMEAAWSRTARLAAMRGASETRVARAFAVKPILIGMAAAFALVAVIGSGAWFLLRPGIRTYATPIGGHETIAFADGTRIELNTDTVIRARMTSDSRTVWLDKGEAFFKVKHDPAHPFVVMVGDRRVTDLGTQFSILRGKSDLEVAVVEGRVWFDAPDKAQSQTSLLTAGQVAMVDKGRLSVTRRTTSELSNELSWRRGMLVFKHRPLADVVREFNRYNREKLVLANADVGALKIYGSFRTEDVELFARVIQVAFQLNIENRGNDIVISR